MKDDSEVRWLLAKEFHPNTNVVTHADYRALEEELAALRGQYEQVRQCCMDETVRATRLMGDLDEMRGKVGDLTSAAKDMSNVLTQAMLNKPIPVYRSANAIQRVESALEAMK